LVRIPRSEQTVGVSANQQPYSVGDGYEAPGRALAQAGQAVSYAANAWDQQQEDLDMFQAKEALVNFTGDQTKKQAEWDDNIQGDGRGHTEQRLTQYDTDFADVKTRVSQRPKVQQYVDLHGAEFRNRYQTQSFRREREQMAISYGLSAHRMIQDRIVPNLTGDIDTTTKALADVDALLDSTPSMPTVIREEIRKNAAKEVYQAWLMKAGPDAGVQAEEIIKQRQAAELGRPKDGLPGAFGETAAPRASGVNNEATGRMGVGGEVYKYFLGKGLQPHQAAAIAGNMAWEGGGKSDLVNPGDNWRNSPGSPHSVGIGQWNDRVPALIRFAREQGIDIPQGSLTNTAYAREVIRRIPLQTQLDFAWSLPTKSCAKGGRGSRRRPRRRPQTISATWLLEPSPPSSAKP
jgi:hypothetical protein